MSKNLVDFSFLEELSDGDPKYKYDVLSIFMDTVPPGLNNLKNLVGEGKDLQEASKQAHALKSSVSIVKITDMYDRLLEIETLGREEKGLDRIREVFELILETFNEAEPIINAEIEKNRPSE